MTIIAVIPDTNPYDPDIDWIYIHGARIADPENDINVTWDQSVEPSQPVFAISLASSENEQPYRDMLAEYGLTVVGTDDLGNWILDQVRPL